MNLYDPQRRRVNDRPEILGRHFAVPNLLVFPGEGDEEIAISAMIPDDRNHVKFSARQVRRTVRVSDLPKIIEAYRDDPEGTLETLFNITLAPLAEPNDREFLATLRSSRKTPDSVVSGPSLVERVANAI